jgi:hypothetical protein
MVRRLGIDVEDLRCEIHMYSNGHGVCARRCVPWRATQARASSHRDPCRKAELLDVFFVSRSVGEGLAVIRQRYVIYQHVSRRGGLQYRRYHVRYIPSMVRERSVPR